MICMISSNYICREESENKVDLIMENEQIIIRPMAKPRKGWGKAFMEMNVNGDDTLLINDVFDDENPEEWKFKRLKEF